MKLQFDNNSSSWTIDYVDNENETLVLLDGGRHGHDGIDASMGIFLMPLLFLAIIPILIAVLVLHIVLARSQQVQPETVIQD